MGKGKRIRSQRLKLPFNQPSREWIEHECPFEVISRETGERLEISKAFINSETGMQVIVSTENHGADGYWVHISASFADRVPEYAELRELKNEFLGREKCAVQVLPKESDYTNLHEHTLHIWHKIGERMTP